MPKKKRWSEGWTPADLKLIEAWAELRASGWRPEPRPMPRREKVAMVIVILATIALIIGAVYFKSVG